MKLTTYQLNAAALLCERWGHAAFKSADRVVVSTPHGSDWITLTPDLLEGLVSDIRAAAAESDLRASASPHAKGEVLKEIAFLALVGDNTPSTMSKALTQIRALAGQALSALPASLEEPQQP